jgi:hypothetical protein
MDRVATARFDGDVGQAAANAVGNRAELREQIIQAKVKGKDRNQRRTLTTSVKIKWRENWSETGNQSDMRTLRIMLRPASEARRIFAHRRQWPAIQTQPGPCLTQAPGTHTA